MEKMTGSMVGKVIRCFRLKVFRLKAEGAPKVIPLW
jgi:hypothetical protein